MDEKTIFNHARRITDSEAREEYLRAVCGDDQTLRKQVDDLLSEAETGSDFLENPLPEFTTQHPSSMIGELIGPYKILQPIGEGGMGMVYMAEQSEPVKRRVALKIIKAGMDSKQVIARFEAERQALAMMDHPNIAKLLDVGTTDKGYPYFVMELVKGIPITQYCNNRKLSVDQRLDLFVSICNAVQHAHQKGIIHRDLKPSNILVADYDDKLVPKIIDFGLAKALHQSLTDKTMFTQLGQVVGTLAYMSPEQSKMNQLDVDTRTDIYSLGVLIYELLTGSTPFEKQRLKSEAIDRVLEIIRKEEPPKPSTRIGESEESLPEISSQRNIVASKLRQSLKGDLDWIVMKALEKDRGRRYESASNLASDIRRHLADEPVVAGPPSFSYKLKKFVQRNRVACSFAGAIAVLLVVALSISSWFIYTTNLKNLKLRIATTVESIHTMRGVILPPLSNLEEFPRQMMYDELKRQFKSTADHRKLALAFALARFKDVQVDFLISKVKDASPNEIENFVNALRAESDLAISTAKKEMDNARQNGDLELMARLAILSFYLGESGPMVEMSQQRSDLSQRTRLINVLASWHGSLMPFVKFVSTEDHMARTAIICGIANISPEDVDGSEKEEWLKTLKKLLAEHPDASTHSAAYWALNQWSDGNFVSSVDVSNTTQSNWQKNSVGMTLIKVRPGSFKRESREAVDPTKFPKIAAQAIIDGTGPSITQTVNLSKPFLMADREVSRVQFDQFMNDEEYPEEEKPSEWNGADERSPTLKHPVQMVSWFDAVLYCNWLSQREGLNPCYKRTGKLIDLGSRKLEEWEFDRSANGYRLPTEAEWEYVCRANTTTQYHHGNSTEFLPGIAVHRMAQTSIPASRQPNSWGFFDMHGNVWEWCSDRHSMYGQQTEVTDPLGKSEMNMRIIRGGGFYTLDSNALGSEYRFAFMPYYRRFNHGFRVARNIGN